MNISVRHFSTLLVQMLQRIKEVLTQKIQRKRCLFVIYIEMMQCASRKETTVRRKYFGTLEFPSSTRFYGQRSTAVASR